MDETDHLVASGADGSFEIALCS
ncbi:MAG: hypothetical protein RLZZ271_1598, partial [Pseudomonadota bacterium]